MNWSMVIMALMAGGMWWHGEQRHAEDMRRQTEFFGAVMDSTRHIIEHGQRVAETSQIRTSDPKVFLTMKSDDPRVQALQREVALYRRELATHGGSVTTFTSSTKIDTTVVVSRDALGGVSMAASDGKWFKMSAAAGGDGNGTMKAEIRNDYTVAIVEEKGRGLVKIKNRNPYSVEDSVKVYATLPKVQKRWGIGPYAGYDVARGASAGIAVTYQFIQW
jgi:hypothetical protein